MYNFDLKSKYRVSMPSKLYLAALGNKPKQIKDFKPLKSIPLAVMDLLEREANL